jgi:hypothetical protein
VQTARRVPRPQRARLGSCLPRAVKRRSPTEPGRHRHSRRTARSRSSGRLHSPSLASYHGQKAPRVESHRGTTRCPGSARRARTRWLQAERRSACDCARSPLGATRRTSAPALSRRQGKSLSEVNCRTARHPQKQRQPLVAPPATQGGGRRYRRSRLRRPRPEPPSLDPPVLRNLKAPRGLLSPSPAR